MPTIINMAQVVTAFADRHPRMCKERTFHRDDSGLGWVKTGRVYESRPHNTPWNNEMAVTFVSDDIQCPPAYGAAPAFAITDWLFLSHDRIGIAGDYEVKLLADRPPQANHRTFGARRGNLGHTPNNVLALLPGQMNADDVGHEVVSHWIDWLGWDASQQGGASVCHNVIDFIGEVETGDGKRWVLRAGSDKRYPHENGHDEGYPYEYWYYDLGPREGTYDPELGVLGYRHEYVGAKGVPNGQVAEEFYARVVPGEFHRVIGTHLSV